MKDNTDLAWTSLCQFQLSSPAPLGMLSSAAFVVSPCYESCQRKYPDFRDQGVFCDEGCLSSTSPALVWAAMTDWHRPGDLHNRHIFLTVLESGKPKMKMSTCLMSGEDPNPGLQTPIFSCCPQCAQQREQACTSFLTRTIIPFMRAPSPWLNHPKDHASYSHHFGG